MNDDQNRVDLSWGGGLDRYKRDLALIRTVMAVVNSSLELNQVLKLALRTILKAFEPGFAGVILLLDREQQRLELAAQQGLPLRDVLSHSAVRESLCNPVIQTGMPLFESACSGYGCPARLADTRSHSHLIFPLKTRQTVVGVACFFCAPDFCLETSELSLWEDIGMLIGRAIEDANLHARLQRERDLLQTLYTVSDHLATSLDLAWVLSRVLDLSISATDAGDGSIFLLPSADAPTPRILRRDLPTSEADLVIDQVLARGLAGWVVDHQLGTIVSDTARDPKWVSFADDPNPPRSALAVPLMAEGRVLGVLTLDHPEEGHFHNRHMILMIAIAHQASAAIEKARLHKKVANMAESLAQRVEERTRELREMQAQLIQAEKLAALGGLAAGVAHEINNPLHILQAYVEYMISHAAPDDAIMEFLGPMQDSLESIARLAGQLRDFSRPTSGEWKPVNINEALRTVLRLVNKELLHCKVKTRQSLAPDLPPVVGDARQLEQVFLNLILNARDAMPAGGRLKIATYANEDTVYIRFTDTGIGIARDDLSRIFEPFFTTKEDRGTGLGLAICQRIVTQHGGKITVSSELGRGTEFIVQLQIDSTRHQ